jgi:hypothetical protein
VTYQVTVIETHGWDCCSLVRMLDVQAAQLGIEYKMFAVVHGSAFLAEAMEADGENSGRFWMKVQAAP